MESSLSPEKVLAARNAEKVKNGLVDAKFFLRGAAEATTDEVYSDANGLYEAFDRGNYKKIISTKPSNS